jgi:hypothetical protein
MLAHFSIPQLEGIAKELYRQTYSIGQARESNIRVFPERATTSRQSGLAFLSCLLV